MSTGRHGIAKIERIEDYSQFDEIIDVRTPAEFSGGHLDGAVNIDIQSPDFVSQIDGLDRNGSYVVYCRSGNRSGMAMAQMLDMGFTDVSNAGSVEEASSSLGIAIVG